MSRFPARQLTRGIFAREEIQTLNLYDMNYIFCYIEMKIFFFLFTYGKMRKIFPHPSFEVKLFFCLQLITQKFIFSL